jgi:hypothetical protein
VGEAAAHSLISIQKAQRWTDAALAVTNAAVPVIMAFDGAGDGCAVLLWMNEVPYWGAPACACLHKGEKVCPYAARFCVLAAG